MPIGPLKWLIRWVPSTLGLQQPLFLQVQLPSTTRRPTSVCLQSWDFLPLQLFLHTCRRALQPPFLRHQFKQHRDKTTKRSTVINSICPSLRMENLFNMKAKRDRKILLRNTIRLSIKLLKTSSRSRILIHRTQNQKKRHQTSSIKLRLRQRRSISLTTRKIWLEVRVMFLQVIMWRSESL